MNSSGSSEWHGLRAQERDSLAHYKELRHLKQHSGLHSLNLIIVRG